MADYTVIVDDRDTQISYGPEADSWSPVEISDAYQGTLHRAISKNANLSFPFIGGLSSSFSDPDPLIAHKILAMKVGR